MVPSERRSFPRHLYQLGDDLRCAPPPQVDRQTIPYLLLKRDISVQTSGVTVSADTRAKIAASRLASAASTTPSWSASRSKNWSSSTSIVRSLAKTRRNEYCMI